MAADRPGATGTVIRRLRLNLFAVGWRFLPGFTLGIVLLLLVTAGVPAASIVAIGFVVGGAADGSSAIVLAGTAFVVLFAIDQICNVVVDVLADRYGGRIQEKAERALIRARLSDPGAGSRALRDALDAVGSAPPMRRLVVSTVRYLLMRAQAVIPGLVLVFVEPLAGVPVLVAFVVLSATMERDYTAEQSAAYSADEESVRAVYLAGLAFHRRTAREVILFRAADWVIGRFREAAHGARPATRVGPPLLAALALAVAAMAFALLVLVRAGLPPAQVVMGVSSLVALMLVFGVTMDVVYSAMGAQVFDRVRLATTTAPPRPAVADPSAPRAGPGSRIRFERVTFRYPGADGPVFSELSFEVELGRSLAIVGANGAGKSTLLKLLVGLLAPSSGRILCDGVEVSVEALRVAWRNSFAFLGQQYVRYPASAYDNVTLGRAESAAEREPRVRALLDDIDPALFVPGAPRLTAAMGAGSGLSGGQWQRLATARALAGMVDDDRRVLVLDEPTAALDAQAEARFFAQLGELAGPGRTTVMVSHRFAGIRRAAEILVLHGGTITERGTHATLMDDDGTYARMFRSQADRYRTPSEGGVAG
ncbi:ABC transporter ATP-binding protein [Micromonospora sp. WMMD1076]|uniref:ATP-binding cassette domain-containing protein n=1 Tax=Micromonospora sp. WMMD1076 TaxID=3016103 RepID=UPI00249A971C|nr:ABC transporter ATP-binding protein [Micromonospora sp. WMMD1076]WFF05920.1 ABC transporter ATP-binding protein [Micromonospora sp. WMMD1076]